MGKIAINLSSGALQQEEVMVGIDLGTTNSLIAYVHPSSKEATIIADTGKLAVMPSAVAVSESGEIMVGENAKHLSNATLYTSFKRNIGQPTTDAFDSIRLSALVLEELKKRAEHALKTPVWQAVITVPARFDDTQRQAIRQAATMAGLQARRIINEPTAAALAYGLNKLGAGKVIIYDLGGGTFDVTVLELQEGIYEVLATNGDLELGGDDIDRAIVEWFATKSVRITQLQAREIKEKLSTNSVIVEEGVTITEQDLSEISRPFIQRTLEAIEVVLKEADIIIADIAEVVLVGGSTHMPQVKQAIAKFFGRIPLQSIDPERVVALGAAMLAQDLQHQHSDNILLDIIPLSLGIETGGGLIDVLLPRNSKIPARVAREYTTSVDGQINIKIAVYQGERDLVEDNRLLGEFILNDIPAMPAGFPKVQVTFAIDVDGVLAVQAKELRSGTMQTVTISPQAGLTDEVVENALLSSFHNAEADVEKRALAEAVTEARQMLYLTKGFMQKHAEVVTEDERTEVTVQIESLESALIENDKSVINNQTAKLQELTNPMAERAMDAAVAKALKDKSLS